MRRSRGDEAPLSLFSFQDIITGVAGVMLFILMLLVIQLAIQSQKQLKAKSQMATEIDPNQPVPSVQPSSSKNPISEAQLQAIERELQREMESVRFARENDSKSMLSMSRNLSSRLNQTQRTLLELASSNQRMEQSQAARSESTATDLQRVSQLEARVAALDSKLQDLGSHPRVNFVVPVAKAGMFLIDVQDGKIEVKEPTKNLENPTTNDALAQKGPERRSISIDYRHSDDLTILTKKIEEVIDSINERKRKDEIDILLIIRPAAAGEASELISLLSSVKGWSVALELLEADAEVGSLAQVGKIED